MRPIKHTRPSLSHLLHRLMVASMYIAMWPSGASQAAQPQQSASDIYKKNSPAIATFKWVDITTKEELAFGTAFFYSKDEIVTNVHVAASQVREHAIPVLEWDDTAGFAIPVAQVVWNSEEDDLAVIRITGMTLPWPFDTTERKLIPEPVVTTRELPEVASKVIVIGSPMGLHGSITDGMVSARRTSPGGADLVQISAPISPGSSGSPVFDSTGRAFGVATWQVIDGQQLNFAVPLAQIPEDRPTSGPALIEWAQTIVTRNEQTETQHLYEQSRDEILAGLRALIDQANGSRTVASPMGYHVEVHKLQGLLASIEDSLPDRLERGATRLSGMCSWSLAASILSTDLEDSLYTAQSDRARRAATLGTADRDVLKWISAFTHDEKILRAAAEALPTDEYVKWKLAVECGNSAREKCSLYNELEDSSDPMFSNLWEDVEEKARESLNGLDWLSGTNPGWKRLPDYWHERAKVELILGDCGAATLSLKSRASHARHMIWMPHNVDERNEPNYLEMIVRYRIGEGSLPAAELRTLISSLCEVSGSLNPNDQGYRWAIARLAQESRQLQSVLSEISRVDAEQIRDSVQLLQDRAARAGATEERP